MSTEEVQVSRKRAASEEAEVTITVKAKKSDFPVTATITLNSDQPKSYQEKSYKQKTSHVDMEASDAVSSALVVTPQRTHSESHLAPSTAPPSPAGAENAVRKEKGNTEPICSVKPASAGPRDHPTPYNRWQDYLNLLKGVTEARTYGMRLDKTVLAGFVKLLFDSDVRQPHFCCDDQVQVLAAVLDLSNRLSPPELWEVELLRSLVKKMNGDYSR